MKLFISIVTLWLGTAASLFGNFPGTTSTFTDQEIIGQVGFENYRVSNIIIGVLPYERVQKQDILIDLKAVLDLREVAQSDALDTTVDYVKLAEISEKEARDGEYLFIDVLGLEILKKIFVLNPTIQEAYIRIQKPAALPEARSGGLVEIALDRKQLMASSDTKPIAGKIGFNGLHIDRPILDEAGKINKQELLVDVRVTIDLQPIAASNELDTTINYVDLANMFKALAATGHYQMVEKLAVEYLKQLHDRYPLIEEACIYIQKPGSSPTSSFKSDAVIALKLTKNKLEVAYVEK